jgi:hypothetical protein
MENALNQLVDDERIKYSRNQTKSKPELHHSRWPQRKIHPMIPAAVVPPS